MKQKINPDFQIELLTRLVLLLRGGMTLVESLRILEPSLKNEKYTALWQGVRKDLSLGNSFSLVCEKYRVFPAFICGMLAVGEKSGRLAEVCQLSCDLLQQRARIKKKIVTALLYPCVLLVTSFAVLFLQLVFVVPKLKTALQQSAGLPALTKLVFAVSGFLSTQGMWVGVFFLCVIILCTLIWHFQTFKFALKNVLLHLPVLKYFALNFYTITAFQLLASMLQSGVTLAPALSFCAESLSDNPWAKIFSEGLSKVRAGKKFSEILPTKICPQYAKDLLAVGEQTGSLANALILSVQWIEGENETRLSRALVLFEPLLLLGLGILIGGIALSVVLPIYNFTGTAGTLR